MNLDEALAENRRRVEAFIAASAPLGETWTTPVRPGKWSPAEVNEHVAMSYVAAADVYATGGDAFPKLPFFLRPLLRRFVFDKVIRNGGDFGRPVKTFKALTPLERRRTPADGAIRVRDALTVFEAKVRAHGTAQVRHTAFGTLDPAAYVMFQAYHTTHHQKQLTP